MKKQFLIIAVTALLGLSTAQPSGPADAPDFDKMFEGVDFEKLLKDVESALEKAEQEQQGNVPPAGQHKSGERLGKQGFKPAYPFASATPGRTAQTKSMVKKDQRMLLLDPDTQALPVKQGHDVTIPTNDSFYAYRDIMDKFTNNLTAIGQKVASIKTFSPAFKETFATYCQNIIDTIVIAHERIESKKIYTKILLATPEANKQLVMAMKRLRQMILDAHDAVAHLNRQLTVSTKDEEQETSIRTLQELAKKAKPEQAGQPLKKVKKSTPKQHKQHQQRPMPELEK
jgi:hypothetical protein